MNSTPRLSRLQKSLRLPVIAPIQRPAGILPTAVRAAEGEVGNLSHLSSATASPARGSSSIAAAARVVFLPSRGRVYVMGGRRASAGG